MPVIFMALFYNEIHSLRNVFTVLLGMDARGMGARAVMNTRALIFITTHPISHSVIGVDRPIGGGAFDAGI